MSPWLTLVPLALAMSAGAAMSYDRACRAAWWFPAAMAGLCVCNGLLWALACRLSADERAIYALSCAYDGLTIACYTVLPLALFGVRLGLTAWVGLALVLAGTLLVKWGS